MIKTKQELLNHFSDINAMYNNPFMYQTLSNMIDELLEQQPCGDCISRKATIDAIYKKHVGGKDAVDNAPINDLYACGLEEAVDAVENMSSVTPSYNSVKPELDCISREAVEKITWEEPSYTDALNVLTEVREKVRALPSVTPKAE